MPNLIDTYRPKSGKKKQRKPKPASQKKGSRKNIRKEKRGAY